MFTTTVLLISNDGDLIRTIGESLAAIRHCRLQPVATIEHACQWLCDGDVGLALVHVVDPEAEGATVCQLLRETNDGPARVPVVVLCEEHEADLRERFVRLGAVDCLARPLNLSRLAFLVDILTVRPRFEGPARRPVCASDAARREQRVAGFVFATPVMQQMLEQFEAVARLDTTVLLTGETGTGKSHLARVIHKLSPRKDKPFVVVHCADLAPTLVESELFGHVRGAFTGAERDHPGKFAEARDGTILIDEIDSLPLSAQGKLLRAVDEREFEAVGSTRPQQLGARLIVATNRSLESEVAAGHFRQDLLYRLNVVSFCLPPLCQRREVIRPLVEKFLADFCRRNECSGRSVSGEAIAALKAFDWPGNVRELRNVVERALALCPHDTIEVADLPEAIRRFSGDGRVVPLCQTVQADPSAASNGLQAARQEAELQRLVEALERHNNNRTRAAEDLGISRVTLYKKLHQYRLA